MSFESTGDRRVRARRFLRRGVFPLLFCAILGCAGTYETLTPPIGANPNPEDTFLDGQYAHNALDEAARMLAAGQYGQAILRLERVIDRFGGTGAGIEARYLIARAYQEIGSNEKAHHYYSAYLSLAEPGAKAEFSRTQLAALDGEARSAAGDEDPTVRRLRRQMESAPEEMTPPLELADYLWNEARYEEAGELYAGLLATWPGLKSDKTINERIEVRADGTYTVLTPEEVLRRSREAEPLAFFNVQSYRSGRGARGSLGFSDAREQYFHVAGEVVNQGEAALRRVTVRITLYGFAKRVYDVRNVNLGTMQPGERRAFSVRFENFDDIENIQDYEYVATYAR